MSSAGLTGRRWSYSSVNLRRSYAASSMPSISGSISGTGCSTSGPSRCATISIMAVASGVSSALNAALINGPYKRQAIVPPFPWLDHEPPQPPVIRTHIADDALRISWSHPNAPDVFRWVVYYQYKDSWSYSILNRNDSSLAIPLSHTVKEPQRGRGAQKAKETIERLTRAAVTAVDRMGNESAPAQTVPGALQ